MEIMMKKRCLPLLLALALVLAVLPAGAWAAGPSSSVGETILTGADLWLYRQLKEEAAKVADGALDSSIFVFDLTGLGVTCRSGGLDNLDCSRVLNALLVDCPYELYWHDKEEGESYDASYNTRTYEVTSITVSLAVSEEYAVTDDVENVYYLYRPDTAKTSAAAAIVRNAQAVVDSNSGLSDYEKLAAYRDYICSQVSYNDYAADHDEFPYGNPWQLIYVFDNNPNTNVVCEGYAKAFKYLCDLSTFSNSVECYIFSSDGHMWNVVQINGANYLADITNTDEGMIGELGGLFLVGTPDSDYNGCTIHVPRFDLGDGRYYEATDKVYRYDADTCSLYDESVLILASSDFDPTASAGPSPSAPAPVPGPSTPAPAFTDLAPNGYYLDAVAWAVAQGITSGTTGTTFSPEQYCTHGQILTFLWRAAGKPQSGAAVPIALSGREYYYDAVKWAYEKGMIGPDFNPDAFCDRAWAVYYIWQAFDRPSTAAANPFTDVSDSWSAAAASWAASRGITTGTTPTTFNPKELCTRGQIVTFLYRAYM